jgi:hypothetical protein
MVSDVANEYGIIVLIAEICDLVCFTYSTVLLYCMYALEGQYTNLIWVAPHLIFCPSIMSLFIRGSRCPADIKPSSITLTYFRQK